MKLALQAQNLEFKAKRYEDFSAQIGGILLEAKHNAEETISQAEQKAEQIKHNAVAANEQITDSLNAVRREIKDVRNQFENIMKDLLSKIDEIDINLEKAAVSAEIKSGEVEKVEESVDVIEEIESFEPELEPEKEFFR